MQEKPEKHKPERKQKPERMGETIEKVRQQNAWKIKTAAGKKRGLTRRTRKVHISQTPGT